MYHINDLQNKIIERGFKLNDVNNLSNNNNSSDSDSNNNNQYSIWTISYPEIFLTPNLGQVQNKKNNFLFIIDTLLLYLQLSIVLLVFMAYLSLGAIGKYNTMHIMYLVLSSNSNSKYNYMVSLSYTTY